VARVLETQPTHTPVGIVAHGTVMTLLVAAANQLDPLVFWSRLGLPAYVVLDLPDYRMREIVERVE